MGHLDGVEGIRLKEVSVFRIGLIHVYNSMDFYDLLFFVLHVLSLGKFRDLLLYLSLRIIHCILAELLYLYQTVGA